VQGDATSNLVMTLEHAILLTVFVVYCMLVVCRSLAAIDHRQLLFVCGVGDSVLHATTTGRRGSSGMGQAIYPYSTLCMCATLLMTMSEMRDER
jgi:hypothetical protein